MRMDESYVPLTKEGEDGDDSVRILHGVHGPRKHYMYAWEPKYKLLVAVICLLVVFTFALSVALALVLSQPNHTGPNHKGFSYGAKKIERHVADSHHLGDHANGETMFGLSIFHQLHCQSSLSTRTMVSERGLVAAYACVCVLPKCVHFTFTDRPLRVDQ